MDVHPNPHASAWAVGALVLVAIGALHAEEVAQFLDWVVRTRIEMYQQFNSDLSALWRAATLE